MRKDDKKLEKECRQRRSEYLRKKFEEELFGSGERMRRRK
jgi:hypothetical protein